MDTNAEMCIDGERMNEEVMTGNGHNQICALMRKGIN